MSDESPEDVLTTATWTLHDAGGDAEHVRAVRLDVAAGPDAGLSRSFASPRIRLGRTGSDLVLSDKLVSSQHCELTLEEDGYRLRDLGSTNGTYVRGVRVLDAYVEPGTEIALGDTLVRFTALGGSARLPLWKDDVFEGMVGKSTPMRRLFAEIDRVAATDATVLVTGETGVGKERVAHAIHARSPREEGPLVTLDCGAIPRSLFEAQLFGHEPGAFTGATHAAPGVFELANGGTLFLDEIGELPLELQSRLLRAVETRTVRRLGGSETIECDVRLVAATNRDLGGEVNRGAFRADLYYRLAVVHVRVPALRERGPGDVDRLVEHFFSLLPPHERAPLPEAFLAWARARSWPGNVRELESAVSRAALLGAWEEPGPPTDAHVDTRGAEIDLDVPFRVAKQRMIDAFERRYLVALFDAHDGNVSAAARAAGLDRMSVYKAMARLGLGARREP
ncbi:MAG: sigma 54-interacting transcriptional regulator [Sandaracinus sp.]